MLDIKLIAEKTDEVKKYLNGRNYDSSILEEVLRINQERKALIQSTESIRAQVKKVSQEVGELKKKGLPADELMQNVSKLKSQSADDDAKLEALTQEQNHLLLTIPNMRLEEVPIGKDESDNLEIHRKGTPKKFDFTPKDHVAIGEGLGMLDFEAATKITGSRFVVYKKDLARLERALINFMLDEHTKAGYTEVIPPFIIHERSLVGTGQLPKFKEDLFKLEGRDWYLAPTAEVPLTNIKRDEIFERKELPLLYCAYSPCFRSEAGSYGKDTRGLIRMHQFNKVELVNIVDAHKSNDAFEDMLNRASSILDLLELPYRALLLCTGDMGFTARKTVDLEVWVPAQNCYREISSVSTCGDFQARRAGIRYRNAEGKPEFAHTLNGSGLAVGRTVVAILENYQNADGTVTIPKVLRGYMGGQELLAPK